MRVDEAHVHWNWNYGALEVFLVGTDKQYETLPNGDVRSVRMLAKPVESMYIEPGAEPQQPTFRIAPEAAQQFMDSLWKSGLRPTEGTGSAGSLAATEKHLSDMRAIVSKQLGVQLISHAIQR